MLEAPMGIVWVASEEMGTEKVECLKPFDQKGSFLLSIREMSMPSP
jgi:hypothetical protein